MDKLGVSAEAMDLVVAAELAGPAARAALFLQAVARNRNPGNRSQRAGAALQE